jgi:hypothetical protein
LKQRPSSPGFVTIDGMQCTEITRKIVPTLASPNPAYSYKSGTRVICTDIVVEDSFSCVCIGEQQQAVVDVSYNYENWEVLYRCCNVAEQCGSDDCQYKTKIELRNATSGQIKRYIPIPGPSKATVIRHGVTNAKAFSIISSDQWCSACPNGKGKPM